jgi:hypothetical protein
VRFHPDPMAALEALEAAKRGALRIIPERTEPSLTRLATAATIVWGRVCGDRCARAQTIRLDNKPSAYVGTAPLCARYRCTSIRGLCSHRANSSNRGTH